MTKFDTITRQFVAIALTVLASTTMLLGAVGPAQVDGGSATQIARAIA